MAICRGWTPRPGAGWGDPPVTASGAPPQPQVTVVVPTRDTPAPMLRRALESVLGQVGAGLALVVVDDGGREPFSGLDRLLDDPRIDWLALPGSLGPAAARNRGAARAGTPWLAFLDADDWWAPDKLARQLARLEAEPDARWAYCGIWEHADAERGIPIRPGPEGAILEDVLRAQCITGSASAVMVASDLFREVGGFAEGLELAEDWDLWIRLAERAPVVAVPELLVHLSAFAFGSRSAELERAERRRLAVLDRHRDAYRRRDLEARMRRRLWQVGVRRALMKRRPTRALALLARPVGGLPPVGLALQTLVCLLWPDALRRMRLRWLRRVPPDEASGAQRRLRLFLPWRDDLRHPNKVRDNHIAALAARHELVLAVRADAVIGDHVGGDGLQILRVPGARSGIGRLVYLLGILRAWRRTARQAPFDAVVALIGEEPGGLLLHWLHPGAALVLDIYDLPAARVNDGTLLRRPGAALYAALVRRALHAADGVVATIDVAALADQPLDPARLRQVDGGVDVEAFATPDAGADDRVAGLRPPGGAALMVYAGAIHPSRGSLRMLALLQALRARGRDLALLVVGPDVDGSAAQLRAAVAAAGLQDRVCVSAERPAADVPAILAMADVALSLLDDRAQYRHSFPVKLAEYMAAGVPTLATDLPGTRARIGDPPAALLCAPDDLAAMADAVECLLDDAARRAALVERGRSRARELDWSLGRRAFSDAVSTLVESRA